jgi:hypothetical protein
MLTTIRGMAGPIALAILMVGPVWAADAGTRQAALHKTQARIDKVQAKLDAVPQDTEQAQAAVASVQKILDVAARCQAKGQPQLARLHADMADRILEVNAKLLALTAAASSGGAQQ